mmetsp:Transcript_29235/g.83562  ORF Transcript_29235/g.83562 Transcript_29235/m.83562 type:complete len:266 (-) Transcript_29235:1011-1808(-)
MGSSSSLPPANIQSLSLDGFSIAPRATKSFPTTRATTVLPVPGLPKKRMWKLWLFNGSSPCCLRSCANCTVVNISRMVRFTVNNPIYSSNSSKIVLTFGSEISMSIALSTTEVVDRSPSSTAVAPAQSSRDFCNKSLKLHTDRMRPPVHSFSSSGTAWLAALQVPRSASATSCPPTAAISTSCSSVTSCLVACPPCEAATARTDMDRRAPSNMLRTARPLPLSRVAPAHAPLSISAFVQQPVLDMITSFIHSLAVAVGSMLCWLS